MVTFGCLRLGGRWDGLTALLPFPEQLQRAACTAGSVTWEGLPRQDVQIPNLLMKKGLAGMT